MLVDQSLYVFLEDLIYSIEQGKSGLFPFLHKLGDVGLLNNERVMVRQFAGTGS